MAVCNSPLDQVETYSFGVALPFPPRMGAEQSAQANAAAATAFKTFYASLPDEAHAQIQALCAKDDVRLLHPNPHAPPPFPAVPIGVTVRLREGMAAAALATVPRLQRKHYELIPKSLTEMDFWISFFTHVTVIVQQCCPAQMAALAKASGEDNWKGNDTRQSANSFEAVWTALTDAQRAAVVDLCARESDALLEPNTAAAPPAFPTLPLGLECFLDEMAATAALTHVPGLQKKHYALVPKKLSERAFWTNFFTHLTAVVRPTAGGSV